MNTKERILFRQSSTCIMTVTARWRSAVRSRPELDAHFAQYELVVVDDACTDDTVARLREWGPRAGRPADDFAYEPLPWA